MTTINAGNFADHLPLDYAYSLCDGVTLADDTCLVVSRLVAWAAGRGCEISREDAVDLLTAICSNLTQIGIE